MSYEQSRSEVQRSHTLSMENRDKLSLTGVEDVSGFDESLVVLTTSMGELTVRGEGLHIERIDLDSGQLEVRGKVQELSYDERTEGHAVVAPVRQLTWGRALKGRRWSCLPSCLAECCSGLRMICSAR